MVLGLGDSAGVQHLYWTISTGLYPTFCDREDTVKKRFLSAIRNVDHAARRHGMSKEVYSMIKI